MEKTVIKNRKGQRVVVVVEKHEQPKGLAFVMHGLSGNKEQEHIVVFAEAFKEMGYTVVLFDTTNTFGESDGQYADATTTNYYEDLEDVINWAKTQLWYQEPFCLAGHSLGGYGVAKYAQGHPKELKGVAPISPVVSGKLSLELRPKKQIEDWEKTGWLSEESSTRPGFIKNLKWTFARDLYKHDLLLKADTLTMPVLIIVGELDNGTPLSHQKLLYEKLPGKKELHVIKGAQHTFVDPNHLAEIKQIFKTWIAGL